MLHLVEDAAAALAALGEPGPADFTFRNFSRRPKTHLFMHPDTNALVALSGADLMLLAGSEEVRRQAMADVFTASFAPSSTWPDEHALKDWQREGEPFIFCNSSPIAVWEAGLQAGFVDPDGKERDHFANLYWFPGKPRFSHLIEHSCRLGRGMELYDRLRSGVGYDEEGYYTRMVLAENPSFVCEVHGQPVCWSTIHLNGTMGMIFTPEEHRRHGYARSLACFQIDHELRRRRFACCHVNNENVASSSMLLELGATKDDTPLGWRPLHWPDGACPYSV
jgi:hypothetical protein